MSRTFLIANLDNWYGRLERLADAMKEREDFPFDLDGPLDRHGAERVAEAYAEDRFEDWEYPNSFDLIIWELQEDDEGAEIPPRQVFRVKIGVRFRPEFHDRWGEAVEVPA